MKKILYLVTIAFFLISSYLFFDYSSKKELANLLGNENYYVNVSTKTNEGILEGFLDVVNKHNVNVQKSVYRLQTDGSFIIDIYAQINKPSVFYDKVVFKHGSKIVSDSPSSSYVSTKASNDKGCIGVISLLNKTNEIQIKKLADANKENLNGVYYFSGIRNKQQFKRIVKDLKANGIRMEDQEIYSKSGVTLAMNVFSFIPLILLLVIITTIYNYIMSYKELSVMMLNGYSCKDIVLKKAKSFLLSNVILALLITTLILVYHYMVYRVVNVNLYISVTIFLMLISLLVTLLEIACGLIVKTIDIVICLRNKRPQKQINIINIIAKFCFSFLIIYMGANSALKINEFNKQNYNMEAWTKSINYSFTMVNSYTPTASGSTYEIGTKCQKLFSILDEKGAIMIRLSGYYLAQEHGVVNEENTQERYITDSIEVNNNYVLKYPVYDIYGKKVAPISTTEDILTILVPEKYLPQKEELEKSYNEAFKEIRYFDENLYNEDKGLAIIDKQQEIKFIYIKNNQKFFTFNPEVCLENNNYVIDPVIIMTNAINRGSDVYYSMMTSGELLAKIANPASPYDELYPYIKEVGLEKSITATPTVYSRVDQKQYELQQLLGEYIFMLMISLLGYIVITIFITLNYIESNKEINVIKKLFGYSFQKRNRKYYMLSMLPTIILTPLFLVAYKLFMFSVQAFLLLIIIDIVTISITLYLYDKQTMNDVLKGS